jgi:lysophospholipase L1-like esterase
MHESHATRIAFVGGAVTALSLVGLLVAFAAWRLGPAELRRQAMNVVVPGGVTSPDRAELPEAIVEELTALGAVVDNSDNPTGARDHDNLLVQPDERRRFSLRPNARVDAYMLATEHALNLDPPVVYLRPDAPQSPALRAFLDGNTRLRYRFTVDGRGFRRTVPAVESPRRVLIVGDSVAFGVGVNDEATMASALQQTVGTALQIVNAGVGEYDVDEVYRTADLLSAQGRYEALIYVACQNDFDDRSPEATLASATQMLERLGALGPRVGHRVAVLLQAHMEYTAWDILQTAGGSPAEKSRTDHLRRHLPAVAQRLGFPYVDWTDLVAPYAQQEGTLFHRFAFYVDHVHFSPLGHRLAARELHGVLAGWGLCAR